MELRGSSEYLPDFASIRIGLDASLMPLAFAGLQGLHFVRFREKPKPIPEPLVNFRSPTENSQASSDRLCTGDYSLVPATVPSLEFLPLQRFPTCGSGFRGRPVPEPTACALGFSQPLDAFIRPTLTGPVSCRIRSWGSPYKAFLLSRSLHAVSGARALMPFEHAPEPSRAITMSRAPKCRATTTSHNGKAPGTPLDFKALLHTKVRHFRPAV